MNENTGKAVNDYIRLKIAKGNLEAYNILTNLSYEMLLRGESKEYIFERIDNLLKPLS